MAREYDKLVRDEIPAIVEADGEEPVVHVADGEEFEECLREARRGGRGVRGEIDELADVLAVVDAYTDHADLEAGRLDARRAEKAADRGGFEERIVLERVEE